MLHRHSHELRREIFAAACIIAAGMRSRQGIFWGFSLTDLRQVSVGAFALPVMCPRLSLLTRLLINFFLHSYRQIFNTELLH